jgi:uncharacterized short protein YbdD (DUF466 family)
MGEVGAEPGALGKGRGSLMPETGGPERTTFEFVLTVARGIRWWIASVMGDNAYAHYVDHLARQHPGCPVPTEKEYWRERYGAMDANPGARCC